MWRVPALLPYIVPFAQSLMGQFVILITCVAVYAPMTEMREIIGLQTCGISARCIMRPAFILAFFMSFFTLWMTDVYMSWGKYGIAEVVSSSIENILYNTMRVEHRIEYQSYTMTVKSVDGKILNELVMAHKDSTKVPTLAARSAQIEIGRRDVLEKPNEEVLDVQPFFENMTARPKKGAAQTVVKKNPNETVTKVTVVDVTVRTDGTKLSFPGKRVLYFSLYQPSGKLAMGMFDERPATMSFENLKNFKIEMKQNIQDAETQLLELSAMNLLFLSWDHYYQKEWNDLRKQISAAEKGLRRAEIEPTRRISNAANCFFLALLIVPLAIRYGDASPVNLFLTLFVITAATYFLAQILILNCVKTQVLPAISMWIPNIVAFFVSLYWIRKVS